MRYWAHTKGLKIFQYWVDTFHFIQPAIGKAPLMETRHIMQISVVVAYTYIYIYMYYTP